MYFRKPLTAVVVASSLFLSACEQAPVQQLKSLVIEFPSQDLVQITIQSESNEYQYQFSPELLSQPEQLAAQLKRVPDPMRDEVLGMLADVEPPAPEPISKELSRSVEAFEGLLNAMGEDLESLNVQLDNHGSEYQSELEKHMGQLTEEAKQMAQKAEQEASGFMSKMKREYVNHMAEMIVSDELTDEDVKVLEQAIIERYKAQKNAK
ncbi:hypothetical protein [Echinimonas agarilytica]|uniref:Uncharacterized protein n=1 Tax=Echinimonas agarilytica TaxID=1215918 RepID=A0AA42B781_9GAMM|nr:hypothetical protein [Echinimonas agarilytica]MCM2679331.1 hypothetical protein [Echinimonas agarilytica]